MKGLEENSSSHGYKSSDNNQKAINDSCELPSDWKSFLADRNSKRSLVNYLSATFTSLVPKFLTDGQYFTTAGGFDDDKKDKSITCTNSENFENVILNSNHEEADSRVWFHALKSQGRNVLIYSLDTDTVHIEFPFISQQCEEENVVIQLSDKLGHQSFIYINELCKCLKNDPDLAQIKTESIYSIMQFLFIVSGCDYISFFTGFGKTRFLETFFQYATFISADSVLYPGELGSKINGFLAFLRLVGCLYYKKYLSAFPDKSPSNFFKNFSGIDMSDVHVQWLAKIRERV